MAPELIDSWKNPSPDQRVLDPKMCDVYSFGILVNEVVYQQKPFKELTSENCHKRKVTNREKPEIPKAKENKEFVEVGNTLITLMNDCWNDTPSERIPFSKILQPGGLLSKIKKNITTISKSSEILRDKLLKKYENGIEYVDFYQVFWEKFEAVFGKENSENVVAFFKIILNVNDYQQSKVFKKDALRICDWLCGADSTWISGGFKNSFFYQHYFGEKDEYEITKDLTLIKEDDECLAILHWHPTNNAFMMSVRCSLKWEHHPLNTKAISYVDLKKEADKVISKMGYKDPKWVSSTIFDRLNVSGKNLFHAYLKASSSDKISSIYVY